MSASSIRARVRAELTGEIKAIARRHLATDGGNLSLRAVARDLGMVSSAVYRYFPSRDALLTALIVDAYEALGAAAEAADAALSRTDLRGRWLAVGHSVRSWSLSHPAEYALLYGSPVPGYAAPTETVPPGQRVTLALVRIVLDGARTGRLTPPAGSAPPPAVRADLERLVRRYGGGLPADDLARALAGWSQLFGLVSFEVFGRIGQVVEEPGAYFEHQLRLTADLAGLPG
ncbi:TetR/AcrR family transcriptional regulator [Plantactinospora sp. CA-290183]|uniref:TetR/AcrR family transcriptional regulator n=1 Tax=Plantactinospora sp. CA-290183 TaxID=3240006 RepID=UPI003D8F9F6A